MASAAPQSCAAIAVGDLYIYPNPLFQYFRRSSPFHKSFLHLTHSPHNFPHHTLSFIIRALPQRHRVTPNKFGLELPPALFLSLPLPWLHPISVPLAVHTASYPAVPHWGICLSRLTLPWPRSHSTVAYARHDCRRRGCIPAWHFPVAYDPCPGRSGSTRVICLGPSCMTLAYYLTVRVHATYVPSWVVTRFPLTSGVTCPRL